MSIRNNAYEPLYALDLPKDQLERAKARVRVAKKYYMETLGLPDYAALQKAMDAELASHKPKAAFPEPPAGSGLEVRGAANPTEGTDPLHWSFTFYDIALEDEKGRPGRKRRIKYNEIPGEVAEKFPDNIDEMIALKHRFEAASAGMKWRIDQQNAWIEQLKEHKQLREQFYIELEKKSEETDQRKGDVSSIKSGLRIVFDFYLNKESNYYLPDIRQWPYYFKEYREHLKTLTPRRRFAKDPKSLKKNTQKNYIRALNRYLEFAWEAGKLPGKAPKCENYARSELERRDVNSLLFQEEVDAWEKHWEKLDPVVAKYMRVANHVAARPSEMLALSVPDIIIGELKPSKADRAMSSVKKGVESELKQMGHTIHGYVVIKTQVDRVLRPDGVNVMKYPLKHRKTVDPKFYRYVPIIDRRVWDDIRSLANGQREAFGQKRWGGEHSNYLLFNDLTLHSLEEKYRDFRHGTKWESKKHVPYCSRHTGCTFWVMTFGGEDGLEQAKVILGHRDTTETEGYCHLMTLLAEEIEKNRNRDLGDSFFDQFNEPEPPTDKP